MATLICLLIVINADELKFATTNMFDVGYVRINEICKLTLTEKPLVVLIASYNNAKWYKKNLNSALGQRYANYRIIYVDDCSSDGTGNLVEQYLKQHPRGRKVLLIKNKIRKFKMANFYEAIHGLCRNEEIIVELDGDDWYAFDGVLRVINYVYNNFSVWLTYGNIIKWPSDSPNYLPLLPERLVKGATFRLWGNRQYDIRMQPRTFYAGLFKKIGRQDLSYGGQFVLAAADVAMMLPMIEMATPHFMCIQYPLYVYNTQTFIRDFDVRPQQQMAIDRYVRCNLMRYKKINGIQEIMSAS